MTNINPIANGHPAAGAKANPASRSSNLANRVRGAVEFIYGAGENLRGTLLAAVDTVIRPDGGVTKNDELAHQGRIAMERGLAKMKGQGGTDVNHDVDGTDHFYPPEYRAGPWTDGGQGPVGDDRFIHGKSAGPGAAAANAEPIGQAYGSQKLDHNRGMEMPRSSVQQPESETRGGYPAQQTLSKETELQSHNASGLPYPRHHRDDAISGVSQGQLNEIKASDERRGHGGGQPQFQQDNHGSGAHPSAGPEIGALRDRGLSRWWVT